MDEDGNLQISNSNYNGEEEGDPENNTLNQPLLKRHRTLSSTPLALVGAKVSHIESLDYEYVFFIFQILISFKYFTSFLQSFNITLF